MCAEIGKQAGLAEVKEKESSKQIWGTKEDLNGDFEILGWQVWTIVTEVFLSSISSKYLLKITLITKFESYETVLS